MLRSSRPRPDAGDSADEELNLPPKLYSHSLRQRAATAVARNSYDSVVKVIVRTTGGAIPKRRLELAVVSTAQNFEAYYETSLDITKKGITNSARAFKSTRPRSANVILTHNAGSPVFLFQVVFFMTFHPLPTTERRRLPGRPSRIEAPGTEPASVF